MTLQQAVKAAREAGTCLVRREALSWRSMRYVSDGKAEITETIENIIADDWLPCDDGGNPVECAAPEPAVDTGPLWEQAVRSVECEFPEHWHIWRRIRTRVAELKASRTD